MVENCGCGTGPTLLFACSGASDTGAISDLTARRLTLEGRGKMSCLAQVGTGNKPLIESAQKATVLVIDGCPVDCAKKTLESRGITKMLHLRVTDQGLKKGQSPANAENVHLTARLAASMLANPTTEKGGYRG
jgi:uncharacterized metal-binding protein